MDRHRTAQFAGGARSSDYQKPATRTLGTSLSCSPATASHLVEKCGGRLAAAAWDDGTVARDYTWARCAVGRDAVTVGDIANALRLGRHQARHLLITSDVPARLLIRKWRGPGGRWWQREVWSAPPEVLLVLWLEHCYRKYARDARLVRLRPKNLLDTYWRKELAQARQRLDERLASDKRWTQKQPK
jgi:hypothetical protein